MDANWQEHTTMTVHFTVQIINFTTLQLYLKVTTATPGNVLVCRDNYSQLHFVIHELNSVVFRAPPRQRGTAKIGNQMRRHMVFGQQLKNKKLAADKLNKECMNMYMKWGGKGWV